MSMITSANALPDGRVARPRANILVWASTTLLMTVLAVCCGAALAYAIGQNFLPAAPAVTGSAPKPPALNPDYAGRAVTISAKPMVTNLSAPGATWIRLEGSFVTTGLEPLAAERLVAEVQQDMLSYLHSTTLAQVEGASGLLHLREDLNDIAKVHSDGHVTEFILETMVLQ